MNIDAAVQYGADFLLEASSSARLDAELLLAHTLGKQRAYLYTWPEKALTSEQTSLFNNFLAKRATLYPIAYLTGHQEFWSLDLKVTADVLIPRADTELLVEVALDKIAGLDAPNILELGTGSGAIALALATERPDSKVVATDLSQAALSVAAENQRSLKIGNIRFLQSDWFENIPTEKFDLIVSNPPYIDPDDSHLAEGIRHEPLQALVAESNGLHDLQQIATTAPNYLNDTGWLIMEHGYDQGEQVSNILNEAAYQAISCMKDLAGNDRINLGIRPVTA